MAKSNTQEINQNLISNEIKRFAVDSSGRLGSLYDGYRDCVLGQLKLKTIENLNRSLGPVQCEVIKGEINKSIDLSQLVNIEEDLQLSILLNLAPKSNITSIVDYFHPINEFTRIFHYSYKNGEESLTNLTEIQQLIHSLKIQTNATHIITGINWGIHLVAILQLPTEVETITKIDNILQKFRTVLSNYPSIWTLETDDKILLETILDTKIYSNISELTRLTTLWDVCRYIDQIKNATIYYPMRYTLRSIKWLYPKYSGSSTKFISIPSTFINQIKIHLLEFSYKIKTIEISINENLPKLLSEYLKEQLYDAHKQYLNINKNFLNEIERLSKLFIEVRHGQIELSIFKTSLHNSLLENTINNLIENLKNLEDKAYLINNLEQFKYFNVDKNDTLETIERKLILDKQYDRILCTNDTLNTNNPEQLIELCDKLIKEYEINNTLRLIYADFSYSLFQLDEMIILPLNEKNISLSLNIDTINILLLGEIGVGKSTFINSFIFESFQIAKSNKSISFSQSYLFHLKEYNGKKFRFIDTPDFGDTRGIEYDNYNIQHILEYINNLSHINAICFLFKSNIEELNKFYQSCIIQLIDHFGENIRENFIFCFTNSHTCLFNSDNTFFKKDNLFYFDNYENSWSNSLKESNRLINYICKNIIPYHMENKWKLIKEIQFEIIYMIRPLLETIRNILRNILLYTSDLSNIFIELSPKSLDYLHLQCLLCKPNPIQIGKFWIIPNVIHIIKNKCQTCSCISDQHYPIEYILEYKSSTNSSNFDEMTNMFETLFQAIIEFAYFLKYIARFTKNDPFLIGLTRMLDEENNILERVQSNYFNLQLVQLLKNIIHDYKRKMDAMRLNHSDNNLQVIYDKIKTIRQYPIIWEQIAVIKIRQDITRKHDEFLY